MGCKPIKLLPVRYAISSEDVTPLEAYKKEDLSQVPGYHYTLRTLRNGYVYIYKKGLGFSEIIVEEGKFDGNDWLELTEDCQPVYICFSEHRLDHEVMLKFKSNLGEHMQLLDVPKRESARYAVPISLLNDVVEEYRERPGFLDTLREKLPKIFYPETAYKKGKESTDISKSWQHSAVIINRDKASASYLQKRDTSVWLNPSENKHHAHNKMVKDNELQKAANYPFIVCLFDPLGVGCDLAQINMANEEACDHLASWYSYPVHEAMVLASLRSNLAEMVGPGGYNQARQGRYKQREVSFFKGGGVFNQTRRSGIAGERAGKTLNKIPVYFHEGYEQFMLDYHAMEGEIEKEISNFCKAWKVWLTEKKPDSFLNIFKTYAPMQYKQREEAFAKVHWRMANTSSGPQKANGGAEGNYSGVKLVQDLYIGKKASPEHQSLFYEVIAAECSTEKTNGEPTVTDHTAYILYSFNGAIHEEIIPKSEGSAPLENPLQPIYEKIKPRMGKHAREDKDISGMKEFLTKVAKVDKELENNLNNIFHKDDPNIFTIYTLIEQFDPPVADSFVLVFGEGVNVDTSPFVGKCIGFFNAAETLRAAIQTFYDASKNSKKPLESFGAILLASLEVSVLVSNFCGPKELFRVGSRVLVGIYVAQTLFRIVTLFSKGEYTKAMLNVGALVVYAVAIALQSELLLARVAATSVLRAPNMITFILLAIGLLIDFAIFFSNNDLENWLDRCYWKTSEEGNNPLTFSYKKLLEAGTVDAGLQKRDESMKDRRYAMMQQMYKPAATCRAYKGPEEISPHNFESTLVTDIEFIAAVNDFQALAEISFDFKFQGFSVNIGEMVNAHVISEKQMLQDGSWVACGYYGSWKEICTYLMSKRIYPTVGRAVDVFQEYHIPNGWYEVEVTAAYRAGMRGKDEGQAENSTKDDSSLISSVSVFKILVSGAIIPI